MSSDNRGFFKSGYYLSLVIFLVLLLILGATTSIWQVVSKNNNEDISSVFGYIDVYSLAQDEGYVFSVCKIDDLKDLKEDTVILYDKTYDSGKTELMIGTFKRYITDGDFGNVELKSWQTGTVETYPSTYVLGVQTDTDHVAYILVALFNSSIMLWGFTIVPIVVLIVLLICRKKFSNANGLTSAKKSKRQQRLAQIGASNK